MSDYTIFAQANPGTDYPVKDALLRAQLTLDSDKIDYAASGYGFGYRRNATAGLTAGYYGGVIISGGSLTTIADGTIALTASQTNYVERTKAGVVSKNTSGFTAGSIPMFVAVTNTTDITSVTDKRQRNVFGELQTVGKLAVQLSGMTKSVSVSQVSDATTYGSISFNDVYTQAGMAGIYGGGASGLRLTAPSGATISFENAGSIMMELSSTEVVMTGINTRLSGSGRFLVQDYYGGGFGTRYYCTGGGTMSFNLDDNASYLVLIWSTHSTTAAKQGVYMVTGLNKAVGVNPVVTTIGSSGANWSFSYALYGATDTTMTVTDAGTDNQGTNMTVIRL